MSSTKAQNLGEAGIDRVQEYLPPRSSSKISPKEWESYPQTSKTVKILQSSLASPRKPKSKDPLEVIAYQAPDRLIPVAITSRKKSRRNEKRQAPVDPLIRAVEIGKRFLVRNAQSKTSINYREKTRLSSDSSNDEMPDEVWNEGEMSSRRPLAEVSMNRSSGRPSNDDNSTSVTMKKTARET